MPTAQRPPTTPPKRPVRVWDIVLTILLLLAVAVVTLIASIFGLYLAMAADSCGVRDCDTELIAVGMLFAAVMPWVLLGLAVIGSIVLLILRRLAFWVPLVAAILIIVAFFIGGGLRDRGRSPGADATALGRPTERPHVDWSGARRSPPSRAPRRGPQPPPRALRPSSGFRAECRRTPDGAPGG